MNLDDISVAIRPRNHYEAIDLGFRLARRHWRPLFAAWLSVVVPLVVVLHVVLGNHAGWAVFIFWWLKPLVDRVPLIVLSRAVFAEPPSVRETWRAIPGAMKTGLLGALTILRFDPARSFALPIWQLEGLRGAQRSQRKRTIERRTSAASWLTFSCVNLEAAISSALFGLLVLMTPEQADINWMAWLGGENNPQWFGLLVNAIYIAAVVLIEPFYVAGGFCLYLNRRTILEGWDLEIAFRRLAARIETQVMGRIA